LVSGLAAQCETRIVHLYGNADSCRAQTLSVGLGFGDIAHFTNFNTTVLELVYSVHTARKQVKSGGVNWTLGTLIAF